MGVIIKYGEHDDLNSRIDQSGFFYRFNPIDPRISISINITSGFPFFTCCITVVQFGKLANYYYHQSMPAG
ncbi:MAG: hypothetical protein IPK57_15065 [Chitinophagaceae bacterium]|nr:hypothetical protein [Chitinophagaceae bacterium]